MGDVFHIGKKKRFTLEQACEILPIVRRVTERGVAEVDELHRRYGYPSSAEELARFEEDLNAILQVWADQVLALGCEPKGLWLVDFDNGAGFYCWRYPEMEIGHFHGYDDGFRGRVPIN